MDMVAAALQIWSHGGVVAVAVAIPVVLYKWGPLIRSPTILPTVQNDPLQYKDHEEAGSHDELRKGKVDLCDKNNEINHLIKIHHWYITKFCWNVPNPFYYIHTCGELCILLCIIMNMAISLFFKYN